MRSPYFGKQLKYQPDEQLVASFQPNQAGYMWLANMSHKSPTITINSDGHRGKETDWTKPVVLTVGNSEAFGSGVRDEEVWTSVLEKSFHQIPGLEYVQVVNASHPGHGPFHHFIRIKRVLDQQNKVDVIICRVDIADRYFRPLPPEEIPRQLEDARRRSIIRYYTKGLPYLFNKIQAQMASIKDAMKLKYLTTKLADASHETTGKGKMMWEQNQIWWKEMINLASDKKVSLVFMIYDPFDSSDCIFIEEGLNDLASGHNNIHIFRLGSRAFALNAHSQSELKKAFNATMTQKRDPHANPLQHKLISLAVYHYLTETGLVNEIPRNITFTEKR